MLKNNKFKDIFEERIAKMKKEFTLDVNEDFFKEEAPKLPEDISVKTKEGEVAAAA